MDAIGIKIANGEFYPVIEENSGVKKRLILTTVHDNQKSMQIDLYKSGKKQMAGALYVGSIVVEKIKPGVKGEPSVELVIDSGKDGQLNVDAKDLDPAAAGKLLHLSVALASLEEEQRARNIPDYELESASEPPPAGLYEKARTIRERTDEAKRGFPWLLILLLGLLLLLLGAGVWFFLIREKPLLGTAAPPVRAEETRRPAEPPAPAVPAADQPASPPRTEPARPASAPETKAPAESRPTQIIEAPPRSAAPSPASRPAVRRRSPAPVASYKVPATIPPGGVPYQIRWGDTLWDISEAFYRNPWLYPRIARFNRIGNPDLIIAGRTIRVPPKN
ncbi:MAG: Hsp70 family protein [Treponema sp.]|jgi:hypothetical protein|nr:Hsp70 family protein [Treponema sp.]